MKRDLEKEAQWRIEVAEWEKTDLGAAEYCRQRGIPYPRFNNWLKSLFTLDAQASRVKKEPAAFRAAGSRRRRCWKAALRSTIA